MSELLVGDGTGPAGAGSSLAAGGLSLLHPEEQVFDAMLSGWRNQQVARRLAFSTVEQRERMVRAFAAHSQSYPWLWTAQLVDEWMIDLRAVRGVRASTLRGYQIALRLFCAHVTDSAYAWPTECEQRFGTHPVQVVHEWNSAVHVQDAESDPSRRAFTRDELQAFFDHADGQVAAIRGAGRKGWLPAFRDATLFKVAYGYGLRRNENARCRRLRAQRARCRVRRLRRLLRPARQGQARRPSGAACTPSCPGRWRSSPSGSRKSCPPSAARVRRSGRPNAASA